MRQDINTYPAVLLKHQCMYIMLFNVTTRGDYAPAEENNHFL